MDIETQCIDVRFDVSMVRLIRLRQCVFATIAAIVFYLMCRLNTDFIRKKEHETYIQAGMNAGKDSENFQLENRDFAPFQLDSKLQNLHKSGTSMQKRAEVAHLHFGVGVVVLLLHEMQTEHILSIFLQAFQSWKLFLLKSIDLFLVLSSDFPLSVQQLSTKLDLIDGFEVNGMHVYSLENTTVYIHANMHVMPAPVDTRYKFTCNGLSENKGFSRFYVEGTAWYTYQMFRDHAKFLRKYKFFLKIDYDVYFFKPMYFKILNSFKNKNIVFMHGGMAYHEGCAKNARQISISYLEKFNLTSKSKKARVVNSKGKYFLIDIPSSSDIYYTNFMGGRMSFFSSAGTLRYAKYLFDRGEYFKTRWTDQVYWHNALGIHIQNFEKHVVSLEQYRFKPNILPSLREHSFVHCKSLSGELLNTYYKVLNKSTS